jgi:predicted permease
MRALLRRLKFTLNRQHQLDDLETEMQLHRELRAELLAREGLSSEEAAFASNRHFGNTTLLKEDSHNMLTWNLLEDLLKDLRYSLRSLVANPLFALIAILTLALGIGANTAIFSVINAVLLRGLPVHNPEQLVYLHVEPGQPDGAGNTGNSDSSFSEYVFEQLRTQRQTFSSLSAYVPLSSNKIAIRIGSLPEEAGAEMVSGDFFSGLGVGASCGRVLSLGDEKNHAAVAVLGYGFWNRRFAADCAVVGKTVSIKGNPFTVIGVAARGFGGVEPSPTDIWIPLQVNPALNAWGSEGKNYYANPLWWCLRLVGRLAPHVTPLQAEAQLASAFRRAAYEHLGGKPKAGEQPCKLLLVPARGIGEDGDDYRQPLYFLFVIVAVILGIACGNVAMLLAARNSSRRREFSIRLAIGGSQSRLFRQLLAESLLLSKAGALLGWLFALAFTKVLAGWAGMETSLAPDPSVSLFTGAVMILIALLFGLAPLATVRRVPVGLALKDSSATSFKDKSKSQGSRLIVIAQVALGLVLAVSAGLLTRSLRNLEQANLGLKADGLLVFGLSPQIDARSDQKTIAFYIGLLAKLRSLPGVSSVTLMRNRIGSGWSSNTTAFLDGKAPTGVDSLMRWNSAGPDFFTTLGVPVRQGRDFRDTDSATSQKVAIVNETFAKRFLKGREVLGHLVSYESKVAYTIVGVVADSKYRGVREDPIPMAYFPYTQCVEIGGMHLELRTLGDPAAFLPQARQAVAAFAPDLALLQPMTQREQFDASITQDRLVSRLSFFFSALAILLVASGLYGTLAYSVSRRTSEFGVRMAVGCERPQLLWMILREGMILGALGIVIGLPVAIAVSRWLNSMLFGLTSSDPLTFGFATASIFLVCLAAGLIPAFRAASVDPIRALRYE